MRDLNIFFKANWPILVLAGLTIIFYLTILAGFNFLTNDLLFLHLPVKDYLFSRLQNFQLPLWDPYTLSGRPFLADPQTGVFNPFNLLILPFWQPGNLNWNFWLLEVQAIFSVFLGGVFIYLLMKYYRIGLAGRLISSLIFIFGGFTTGHLIHPNIVQTVIWLPLIFLFYQRALREEKTKFAILSGIFLALAILAGHSQMIYYLFLFLGVYFLYFFFFQSRGKKLFQLGFLLLIIILVGLGLSSIQLIPSLELALSSGRMESGYSSYQFASSYSLPPVHWLIASFLPHFFPNTEAGAQLLGIYACCPWEYTSYLGTISLVLIILGLISKSSPLPKKRDKAALFGCRYSDVPIRQGLRIPLFGCEKWFFFLIFIFSLIVSFGYFTPLYQLLYNYLPGFALFRVPARFLFFVQFAGAILAGFGLNYLLKNYSITKKILRWGLISFLFLILLLIYLISFQSQPFFSWLKWPKIVKQDFLIFSLSFLAGIFILSLGLISRKLQKIAVYGLIIILFAELVLIGQNFWFIFGRYPANQTYSERIETGTFKRNLSDYRVLSRPALPLNAGLIYRIPTLEGWQSLVSSRYNHLLGVDFLYPTTEIDLNRNKKIIDLLNTRYLIFDSANNLRIVENNDALPRAFFVSQAENILPAGKILEEMKKTDYDPRQKIYLEEPPNLTKSEPEVVGQNQVEIINYQPEKIVLKADLQNNGWLFLSEVFYPGWQAFVDKEKTKIYRANYLFRSLPISAGIHQIEFVFKPKSFKIGLIISLITFLAVIILLFFTRFSTFNRSEQNKLKKI